MAYFALLTLYLENLLEIKMRNTTNFVQASLAIQITLAQTVMRKLNVSKVYVYDDAFFFRNATTHIVDNVRYSKRQENYAVLSQAAQQTLTKENYRSHTNHTLLSDHIGLYITS